MKYKRDDFSYTYNSRGYMVQYKGKNIGGAGISKNAKSPVGQAATIQKMIYKVCAEAAINAVIKGCGSKHMLDSIHEIEGGVQYV